MGKGYTLGGFYRMNNYAGFGFLFENNSLKNNRLEWKLIGQQIHSLEPIREAEKKAYYSYRIRSLESGLGRKIDLHHKISFSLGVFNEAYLYQTGDHIPSIPKTFDTSKVILRSLYVLDYLQPYYFSFAGWKNNFQLGYVHGKSIDNNNSFYSIENEILYFKRYRSGANLGLRLKLGL
jgi:hypothetical protein